MRCSALSKHFNPPMQEDTETRARPRNIQRTRRSSSTLLRREGCTQLGREKRSDILLSSTRTLTILQKKTGIWSQCVAAVHSLAWRWQHDPTAFYSSLKEEFIKKDRCCVWLPAEKCRRKLSELPKTSESPPTIHSDCRPTPSVKPLWVEMKEAGNTKRISVTKFCRFGWK